MNTAWWLVLALAGCSGGGLARNDLPRQPDPAPAPSSPPPDAAAPVTPATPKTAAPLPMPDAGAPAVGLTLDERSEIVSSALELALVEKAIPDYNLLKNPKSVVLADANLAGLAPKANGVTLQVMSADAIQSKADREGDFLFLEFGPMTTDADGSIRVSLSNRWALSSASRKAGKIVLSGGGFGLRFRRDRAGWKREVVMKWIS